MRRPDIKIYLTVILTVIVQSIYGQTRAITEKGDTIFVYDNGTWSFEFLEEMPEQINEFSYLSQELVLDTIPAKFKVLPEANKQVKDSRDMFVIKYDEQIWKRVPPATLNDEADFAFQAKKNDIWCIVIAEETPIQHDKLFLIAKNTMKEHTGTDPEVIKTELRTVNGTKLMRGVMKAEYSGIVFIFDTYYFSNDLGSVQFTTWTSEKVWERNESVILNLLNGFMVN